MDGTLFDTWEIHCEAIREAYQTVFHEKISMAKIIRTQRACLTDTIKVIFDEFYDNAFRLYQSAFKRLIAENKLKDKIQICEQLKELADQGYEMCLITGRDAETTNCILNWFSVSSLFKEIYSINECGSSKKAILEKDTARWQEYGYITDSQKEMRDYSELFSDILLVKWFLKQNC